MNKGLGLAQQSPRGCTANLNNQRCTLIFWDKGCPLLNVSAQISAAAWTQTEEVMHFSASTWTGLLFVTYLSRTLRPGKQIDRWHLIICIQRNPKELRGTQKYVQSEHYLTSDKCQWARLCPSSPGWSQVLHCSQQRQTIPNKLHKGHALARYPLHGLDLTMDDKWWRNDWNDKRMNGFDVAPFLPANELPQHRCPRLTERVGECCSEMGVHCWNHHREQHANRKRMQTWIAACWRALVLHSHNGLPWGCSCCALQVGLCHAAHSWKVSLFRTQFENQL